jgi:hypothetical protein
MDPSPDKIHALEQVKERLYRSNAPATEPDFTLSVPEAPTVPHAWVPPHGFGAPHHVRYAYRFFTAAIIFFILAFATSVFVFYTGSNTVSVDNVALTIQGPTTVKGGDTVPLSITITNKNPTALENAVLEITFPEGTRSGTDIGTTLSRVNMPLGTLLPGATIEKSVSAALFGGEGFRSDIQIAVSFGTSRSNAIFVKRSTYPIVISTVPLSVSVDSVSETVSGKPFTIKATVRSNATETLSGVVLSVQYPSGYVLSDSSITPIGANFSVGSLKAGESKTITLTGILNGQNSESRVLHFTVGTSKAANDPSLGIAYMTQDATIAITAPFLATTITVNGSSANNLAVSPGSQVSVSVAWANALAVPIQNAEVQVALSGAAFDPLSVQSQRGFYRSADRTVIFSQDTDRSLVHIAPGASGLGSFNFTTLGIVPRNAATTLTVSIAGERVGQSGIPEQVTATISKVIKLVGAVALTTTTLHSSGPIGNSGAIPPIADRPTSYSVTWSVVNTGNDLASALITATLPTYVAFSGATVPTGELLNYDNASHLMSWQIGEMPAGSHREASFQVILTPSTSQRGTVPSLTSTPSFSAYDRYAQVQVTSRGDAATTETPHDPGYTPSQAVVQ